ncbi:MAG: hypothetical protein ACRDRA_09260 [Pseudonocardiaceae bacterium]
MSWVALGLLALAGFLVGGMVSTWRSSRPVAVVLALAAALATAAGITWML